LQGEETPLQAGDVLALFPKTGEQRAFAHLR
jgi:molybdopterin converting factor small subunit